MLKRLQTQSLSILNKSSTLIQKISQETIYYGKIGIELSKQVYHKEKLQPPNLDTFKHIYGQFYKDSLHYWNNPNELYLRLNKVKKIEKDDFIKVGAIGVQLVGFYSVGEILGRRKLVGYHSYD